MYSQTQQTYNLESDFSTFGDPRLAKTSKYNLTSKESQEDYAKKISLKNKINYLKENHKATKNYDNKVPLTVELNEENEMNKLLKYNNMFKEKAKKDNDINANINDILNNNKVDKEIKIDKNLKQYVDEQTQKIKYFIHDEINSLRIDMIKQFELQNKKNIDALKEFSLLNTQLLLEVQKLKQENEHLKNNNLI